MTKQRQEKLLWVLGRYAYLIKNKEILSDIDRVILTHIRWIKILIVDQTALNKEYKMLKAYDNANRGEDNE